MLRSVKGIASLKTRPEFTWKACTETGYSALGHKNSELFRDGSHGCGVGVVGGEGACGGVGGAVDGCGPGGCRADVVAC